MKSNRKPGITIGAVTESGGISVNGAPQEFAGVAGVDGFEAGDFVAVVFLNDDTPLAIGQAGYKVGGR
jgi:hypothetical protein